MDFLTMAKTARSLSGMQGSGPTSIASTDYDSIFVLLVRQSWNDIQLSKRKWKWMRTSKTFITTIDKTSYSTADIFGPSYTRFSRWDRDFIYITVDTRTSKLRYIDYDTYVYRKLNNDPSCTPSTFTIDPSNENLIIDKPNGVYTITAYYYKSKQELSINTEQPELPEDYHYVIVYQAVARYAISVSLSSVYQEYEGKYSELYDDLVRYQIPKEILKMRGIA
jgi:hypothetical protein